MSYSTRNEAELQQKMSALMYKFEKIAWMQKCARTERILNSTFVFFVLHQAPNPSPQHEGTTQIQSALRTRYLRRMSVNRSVIFLQIIMITAFLQGLNVTSTIGKKSMFMAPMHIFSTLRNINTSGKPDFECFTLVQL